jgi:CheY-like chemotaxis protein
MAVGAPLPTSVVVADDDDRFRKLLCELLADDGYEVVAETGSGADCIRLTNEQRPDVVVIDLILGTSSGLTVADAILQDDPEQPIIILSSLFDPTIEQRAIRLGVDYMDKPDGIEPLEQAIDACAARRFERRGSRTFPLEPTAPA